MEIGSAMAAAPIFSMMVRTGALIAAALVPVVANAQRVERHRSAEEAVKTMRAVEAAAVQNPSFSRWALLPGVHLEDVLYPAPDRRGAVAVAHIVGTSSHVLRNGYSVALTTVRLDNSGTDAGSLRPYDMLRCYEYFKPDFSQESTRCFVLQRRP
jgi:hypothetical protein